MYVICHQNLVDRKYKVAEEGNSQVKYNNLKIVLK